MKRLNIILDKVPYWISLIVVVAIYAALAYLESFLSWNNVLLTIANALLFVAALFLILFVNPVKRDLFLFANKGWGMIWLSVCMIVLVLVAIWSVANIWEVEATDVYSSGDKQSSNQLAWGIISQFADPGNLQQSDPKGAWVALVSALAGVLFLSGLLVSSLVSGIAKVSNRWNKGMVHYNNWFDQWGFNNYTVIVGVNRLTSDIINQQLSSGARFVLVQTRREVEKARAMVNLKLERDEEKRVVFYNGDRALVEDIKDLCLERAREVYIVGEDLHFENEEDHDAYNIACLEHIASYMKTLKKKKNRRLRCHVNFEYQSTFMAFKFTHIYRGLNESVEFLPFNIHEIWAKKVLVDGFAIVLTGKNSEKKVIRYNPVDMYLEKQDGKWNEHYIQRDSTQCVHLVIAGMNQMGVALAMQAALLVHLPNFHSNENRRTTITFIDENAAKEGEFLKSRYDALFSLCRHRTIISQTTPIALDGERKSLDFVTEWSDPAREGRFAFDKNADFMDLQWEFVEGNIASDKIRTYLSALVEDRVHKTVTVAVCFNNPQQSIASALYLPEVVFKRAIQVLVYQQNSFDIIDKVATTEKEWKRYEKLKPFGMIEGCYTERAFDNMLAKYANMVYVDKNLTSDSLDDTPFEESYLFRTNRLWEELGIVDKYANIDLVDSFTMKIRSLLGSKGNQDDWTLEITKAQYAKNIPELSKSEHLRWATERLTMGYRPLEKEEYDKYTKEGKNGSYMYSKRYFQSKTRAHVDICPSEDIPTRDPEAAKRDMDSTLVRMMPLLYQWSWAATIRELCSAKATRCRVSRFPGRTSEDMLRDMVTLTMEEGVKIAIARHPVTLAQWRMVMGSEPKEMPTIRGQKTKRGKKYVDFVSWNDVQDFLIALRKKTGLPFDLPKKDEWDKAKASQKALQLKDMEGKVWQWTKTPSDKYESSFVFCGKSKEFVKHGWEEEFSYWLPDFKSKELGFRLVLRIGMPIEDFNKAIHWNAAQKAKKDDADVIENMIRKMVLIEDDLGEPFRILPTPVTQRQWKAVMYYGKIQSERNNPSVHQGDYFPVENITFSDADEFVKRLNNTGYGKGFSLPSSVQWTRALNNKKIEHGQIIWHNGLAKSTHEVLNYKSPQFKDGVLYDMLGNVWEWCSDKPSADRDGFCRNMQGGSWRFTESDCKKEGGSYWIKDGYRSDDLGFRFVVSEEDYQKHCTRQDDPTV